MKVGIYKTVRGGVQRFLPFAQQYAELELEFFDCEPTLETLPMLKKAGCQGMIYYADYKESEQFFQKIAQQGIKFICVATTGYDMLNIPVMKANGIRGANVPRYSPNAISEHTVLLTLSALRKLRPQVLHVQNNDFAIGGYMGREIRNMTVGIVGAGRIGLTTMKCLSGFAPKRIVAYDPYENDEVKKYAQYLPLQELLQDCDVIIFHCSYNEESHHMVNAQTIARMKDGVLLVNVARGGLFDTRAILEGVASGKIGALALDVIEGEGELESAVPGGKCPLPMLEQLLSFDNVIFTNHTAFFTDQAEEDIVRTTVENLHNYAYSGSCPNEVVF